MDLGQKPGPLTVHLQRGYPLVTGWVLESGTWTAAPTLHLSSGSYPATISGAEATLTIPAATVDTVPDRSKASVSVGTLLWRAGKTQVTE